MKTLRDFEGKEGLEKFGEIEPLILEIIKDDRIKISEMTNFQLGAKALELHPEACEKMIKVFGGEPTSPQGKIAAIASVLVDIITDKDMIDFFVLSGKIMERK